MPYFIKNGKIQAEGIQFAAAYHCNLRCADCLTLSSCAAPGFPAPDTVAADLERLGQVFHAREVRIMGGEPLLNPALGELASIAKRSGIGDKVTMFTNGRYLDRMNDTVWGNLDQLNVSVYPEAPPPEGALDEATGQARARGIELRLFRRHRFYTRVVNQPHPADWLTRLIFQTCRAAHYDHCHWAHEGRLYRCAMPLFLPAYLQRLEQEGYRAEEDGLALAPAAELGERVQRYLLSAEVPASCRYCLGNLGRRRPHRQLTRAEIAAPGDTAITRATHLSRSRIVAHLTSHLRHLAINRVRGGLG